MSARRDTLVGVSKLLALRIRGPWLLLPLLTAIAGLARGHASACLLPTQKLAVSSSRAAASQFGVEFSGRGVVNGAIEHRLLHFTFDDGPTLENTPRLLDYLDRAGIKATFFFSTSRFASRERRNAHSVELAREVARRGHQLGAHGFDHVHMARLKPNELRDQLDNSEAMILRAFGTRTYLFRPPYGSRNRALDRMLEDGRYLTVMWNVGLADWVAHDPEELRKIFWRVLARNEMLDGERGGVVLLHDSHEWSVEAFALIIASIAERNCELLARGEELYDIVDTLGPWLTPFTETEFAVRQSELRARAERSCPRAGTAP